MERSGVLKISNKVIHSKGRGTIRRVIGRCDEEAQNKCLHVSIQKATESAAYYTGVSRATINRIRKRSKENPNEPQETPG
jgi:hypothetical protein